MGGMGYAADLPRQLFLFLLSFTFPDNWLRQIYFFLMLLLGPLGIYFLLSRVIFRGKKIAATAGGLFYLLNLSTIQTFYTPFSAFITHFSFLPWLFLVNILYLKNPNRRNLIAFLAVNFFAIPQSYVPTLFIVYLLSFSILILILFWKIKTIVFFKRALKIFVLTLVINSFWLLPFLYFFFNNAQVTVQSKINQMATEKVYLQNKEFGDISNVLLLKGFWFNNLDFMANRQLDYMLAPWRQHLENPWVVVAGYVIFLIVVLGIVYAFKSKNYYWPVFFAIFLFSFILLANNTLPFSWINDFLRLNLPLFSQTFRFPFTKFSILASFSFAIFFAFGVNWLLSGLDKFSIRIKFTKEIFLISLTALLVFFTLPAFRGELFYQRIRVKIPQSYTDLWDFFRSQDPSGRIANFPQHTFWGWNFYSWGYDGSGFLWYGLKQPILDRAFDVWSRESENYYWEASYALYSKNLDLFEKVLDKYQISWLVLDKNVIYPPSPKALYVDEFISLVKESDRINLVKDFDGVQIYQVASKPINEFVFLIPNPVAVEPVYKWGNYDPAYFENDTYITANELIPDAGNIYYYPFRSLFSGKNQNDLEFRVADQGDHFLFEKNVPGKFKGYMALIPTYNEELPQVEAEDLSKIKYLAPEVQYDGSKISLFIPKVSGYFSAEIDPTQELDVQTPKNCDNFNRGEVKNEIIERDGKKFFRLSAKSASNCSASFWLPNLGHQLSYLITLESENIKGRSPVFWVENLNIRRADTETYLAKNSGIVKSYFIQPPMAKDGLGYSLHFDNTSIGSEESVNDLGRISVSPIPYSFLTNLKLVNSLKTDTATKQFTPKKVEHSNPAAYTVELSPIDKPTTLVLSQSFSNGWQGYAITDSQWGLVNNFKSFLPFVSGQRLTDHVLVNNWENGWILKPGPKQTIILVFWPQYLEYLGFILLIIVPIWFLRRHKSPRQPVLPTDRSGLTPHGGEVKSIYDK